MIQQILWGPQIDEASMPEELYNEWQLHSDMLQWFIDKLPDWYCSSRIVYSFKKNSLEAHTLMFSMNGQYKVRVDHEIREEDSDHIKTPKQLINEIGYNALNLLKDYIERFPK